MHKEPTSGLQHELRKNSLQRDGRRCCNSRRQRRLNSANDEGCVRRSSVPVAASDNDRCVLHATSQHDESGPVRNVDQQRRVVRQAWTSERRGQTKQNSRVNLAADQTANTRRLRDVAVSTGKAAASSSREVKSTHDSQIGSVRVSRLQTAADFATSTDRLTSNIYASMAAFQDVQENDVIDAVRGYIRSQSSSRRRPSTGRRTPAAAGDGAESRSVELRPANVGPLSGLVVIRPATPRPRTCQGPPMSRNDRPGTARVIHVDDQPAAEWHE